VSSEQCLQSSAIGPPLPAECFLFPGGVRARPSVEMCRVTELHSWKLAGGRRGKKEKARAGGVRAAAHHAVAL